MIVHGHAYSDYDDRKREFFSLCDCGHAETGQDVDSADSALLAHIDAANTRTMACSTAGLTRGDTVTVIAVEDPFVTVTKDGAEFLVLVGDLK